MFLNFWEFIIWGDGGFGLSFLKTYLAQQSRFQSTFFFFGKPNLSIVNIEYLEFGLNLIHITMATGTLFLPRSNQKPSDFLECSGS